MKPKLTVLVPIYNVEPFLAKCLSSLVDQTLTELEIFCINDGSTDNSLSVIKEFARNDKRIILINKDNSGYGDSMNLGLKRAHGEYIGILEPDDWIAPDAFEKMYLAAKKYQADVVKTNFYRTSTDAKGITIDVKTHEIALEETIEPKQRRKVFQFMPAIWSAIYRREFIEENQIRFLPTPGASYQDLSFSFKVWALAKTVVLLPEAFVHYRVDNENSSVNNPGKVNCVCDEYAEIETFLCERGIFKDYGETMNAAKFRNYHWNFQRLDSRLAKEFYQTWRKELLSAADEGLLVQGDFSRKDWLALQMILKHPHLAYYILRIRQKLKKLFK